MKAIFALVFTALFAIPAWSDSTQYRLFVLFSTPDMPDPHFEPGWDAKSTVSLESCIAQRDRVLAYLSENIKNDSVKYTAFCVEFHAHGFDEAMEAFRKQIGIKS
jgi:hypothetical protein